MPHLTLPRVMISLVGIVMLTACTQTPTQQISQFGVAVEQLTNEIDSTIATSNEKSVNYQLLKIAAQSRAGQNMPINEGDCAIVLSQGTGNTDTSHDRPAHQADPACALLSQATFEDITPIYAENEIKSLFVVRANKSLKQYAQSLQRLNDAASSAAIDAAVIRLDNALVGIYSHYTVLAEDTGGKQAFETSLAVISTAVNAMGRSFAERQRKQALKTILIESDPWIGRLTEQMTLAIETHRFDDLIGAYDQAELNERFREYNKQVRNQHLSAENSQQRIDQLYAEWQAYSTRSLRKQAVLKSIEAIREGHATLVSQVQADLFTSSEVTRSISELQDHYKSLTSFHDLLTACNGQLALNKDNGEYTCTTDQ